MNYNDKDAAASPGAAREGWAGVWLVPDRPPTAVQALGLKSFKLICFLNKPK